MKYLRAIALLSVLILSTLFSGSVLCTSLIKCVHPDGSVEFSDKPCPSTSNTSIVSTSPTLAKNEISAELLPFSQTYFDPNPSDGMPIRRPAGCVDRVAINDSLVRDLEGGMKLVVVPTKASNKMVFVNVIFVYPENDSLKYSPEQFKLRIFPGEKSITPRNIRESRIFGPSAGFYNQEVYLEFQTQSEKFENIQIDFPDGSIMNGTGRGQQIKPFRFAVTNQVINHTISPEVGQCMYLSK